MKLLDRLEALVQGLIEGIFERLFQARSGPANLVDHPVEASRIETKEALAVTSHHAAKCWLLQFRARQLRLGEPVVNIGRALDNDIILSDPTVSRYHAQLRWREERYHLCPPMPFNGVTGRPVNGTKNANQSNPRTAVNRQPVIRHPLTSGDEITLGNATLVVVVGPEQD